MLKSTRRKLLEKKHKMTLIMHTNLISFKKSKIDADLIKYLLKLYGNVS